MPRVLITLPDNTQSVSRAVIFSVIQQLQAITKIPAESKIFYPGETSRMYTPGSSIDSDNRDARFNTDRYTFIEVNEEYNLDALATTATRKREHIPIFDDPTLKVQIIPVYSTTNVTISFKYRGNSETEVKRWYDDLRIRISELRDINLHTLKYHYPLSIEAILLLKEIYTKRETIAPYNQSLEEYIKAYTGDRLALITDIANNSSSLVVQEMQTRVVGLYDIDGLPAKPERDEGTGTWSISFDYKFTYEKPIEYCLAYPIMVHNQLLEPDYIDFRNTGDGSLEHVTLIASQSLTAFNEFETITQFKKAIKADSILRIPEFDDFTPATVPMGTGSVMTILAEVDVMDAKSLFSLYELGEYVLDADILDFIAQSEYPYITKYYKSILQLALYRNESLIDTGSLTCDQDLNIKTSSQVNFRNTHRVRFGIVTDLSMLDQAALDRLKRFPKAFVKIISAINELLANHPDFVNMGNKRRITQDDFNPIYRLITGEAPLSGSMSGSGYIGGSGSNPNGWESGSAKAEGLRTFYPTLPIKQALKGVSEAEFENYRRNAVFRKTLNIASIVSIANN